MLVGPSFEVVAAKFLTSRGMAVTAGSLALIGFGVAGYASESGPRTHIEQEVEITQRVEGEIVDIDVDVDQVSLVGFTTAIRDPDKVKDPWAVIDQGTQVTLDKKLVAENDLLVPYRLEIPLSNPTLTWNGDVLTRVYADTEMIDQKDYEPGYLDDPTDDRFVIHLPLSAISTQAHVDPMRESYDVSEDVRDLPWNLATAWTQSFTGLKEAPIIGAAALMNNSQEGFMAGAARIGASQAVQKECSGKVMQNEFVYGLTKQRIANSFLGKLHEKAREGTLDPNLVAALKESNLTFYEGLQVPVTVYIGDEDASKPNNLGQLKHFPGQYDEAISKLEKKASLKIEDNYAGDELKCVMSPEVKDYLKQQTSPQPGEELRQRTGS